MEEFHFLAHGSDAEADSGRVGRFGCDNDVLGLNGDLVAGGTDSLDGHIHIPSMADGIGSGLQNDTQILDGYAFLEETPQDLFQHCVGNDTGNHFIA